MVSDVVDSLEYPILNRVGILKLVNKGDRELLPNDLR